jgi:hypothetical protein
VGLGGVGGELTAAILKRNSLRTDSERVLAERGGSPGGGDRGSVKRAELVLVDGTPLVEPGLVAPGLRAGARAAGVSRRVYKGLTGFIWRAWMCAASAGGVFPGSTTSHARFVRKQTCDNDIVRRHGDRCDSTGGADSNSDIALCAIDDSHLIGRLLENCGKGLPHAVMQAALSLPHALVVHDHGSMPGGSERYLEVLGEIGENRAEPFFAVPCLPRIAMV